MAYGKTQKPADASKLRWLVGGLLTKLSAKLSGFQVQEGVQMTFKLAAVAIVALGAAALSSPASAANDACTLLTPAEVGAALGTAAGAGEPITPTDHKVCTWKATDGHSWVTLMLQTPGAFDSGKSLSKRLQKRRAHAGGRPRRRRLLPGRERSGRLGG